MFKLFFLSLEPTMKKKTNDNNNVWKLRSVSCFKKINKIKFLEKMKKYTRRI